MICGIYGIRNKVNGKIYVGQSVNIKIRYADHCRDLRKCKHHNKHLQQSYNKHGLAAFELVVLEECHEDCLPDNEQRWINHFSRNLLYNQVLDIQYRRGESNPFFGKKHTDETKKKMSEWKKNNFIGKNNPNYGKKNTIETRIKMSEGRGRLTQEKVLEIVDLLKEGMSHQEIADKYDIARTAITRISNGTRWTNVTGGPIVPVTYIDGVRQFTNLHRQKIGEKRKGCLHSEETKEKMREKALTKREV